LCDKNHYLSSFDGLNTVFKLIKFYLLTYLIFITLSLLLRAIYVVVISMVVADDNVFVSKQIKQNGFQH